MSKSESEGEEEEKRWKRETNMNFSGADMLFYCCIKYGSMFFCLHPDGSDCFWLKPIYLMYSEPLLSSLKLIILFSVNIG